MECECEMQFSELARSAHWLVSKLAAGVGLRPVVGMPSEVGGRDAEC